MNDRELKKVWFDGNNIIYLNENKLFSNSEYKEIFGVDSIDNKIKENLYVLFSINKNLLYVDKKIYKLFGMPFSRIIYFDTNFNALYEKSENKYYYWDEDRFLEIIREKNLNIFRSKNDRDIFIKKESRISRRKNHDKCLFADNQGGNIYYLIVNSEIICVEKMEYVYHEKEEKSRYYIIDDGVPIEVVKNKVDDEEVWKQIDSEKWFDNRYKLWRDKTKYYKLYYASNDVIYDALYLVSVKQCCGNFICDGLDCSKRKILYYFSDGKEYEFLKKDYQRFCDEDMLIIQQKLAKLPLGEIFCDFKHKVFFDTCIKKCYRWENNELICLENSDENTKCLWASTRNEEAKDAKEGEEGKHATGNKYIYDGFEFREVENDTEHNNWKRKKTEDESERESSYILNWFEAERAWGIYDNNEVNLLWNENENKWWDVKKHLLLNRNKTFYIIKTGISPVYRLDDPFKKLITDSELDDLLNGGIAVPKDIWVRQTISSSQKSKEGMIILVTGAPGTGKTTFALELCYRLSKGILGQEKIKSYYITNEDESSNLNAKLKEITGEELSEINIDFYDRQSIDKEFIDKGYKKEKYFLASIIGIIIGIIISLSYICLSVKTLILELLKALLTSIGIFCSLWLTGIINKGIKRTSRRITYFFDSKDRISIYEDITLKKITKNLKKDDMNNSIVVVDSLNSIIDYNDDENLTPERRYALFKELSEELKKKFPISIILMDTGPGFSPEHEWSPAEYASDLEINFSYDSPENYMIRRLWIVKSRYQSHADGFQRIKIDGSGNLKDKDNKNANETGNPVIQKKYATSYFPEGGIHIFSSIHRYLSEARRDLEKGNENNKPVPTPYPALNKAISSDNSTEDGIKPGQCVCIIGDRGTMKSHMAYRMILDGLWENKKGLIISLRDPRDQVYGQLNKIIDNQGLPEKWIKNLQDLIDVLYFWPGYISPDEFLHIVKVAVADEERQYVVINGLEQLPARFPLCAQEKMFISGLLSYLTSRHKIVIVTSSGKIDRPANDGGVPDGLLPMGDIIMQGSVVDIAPKWIWSSNEQNKDKDINELWSSAVDEQYWRHDHTKIDELDERIQFCHKRSQKLENLQRLLYNKYQKDNITQPHVVYDIVRGATGFRECRMRLLCYVTRSDDKIKSITEMISEKLFLNEKNNKEIIEKILNCIKEKKFKLKTKDEKGKDYKDDIDEIKKIYNKAENKIKVFIDGMSDLPFENQVFLARIPEAITTKIYHSDDANKTNKQNDSFNETINEAVSKLITTQSEAQQSENRNKNTRIRTHKRLSH